jgi:hypothetical protein
MMDSQELDPIAGMSCAAACISIELSMVGSSCAFKPVYTHQCFQDEVIPGFEPFQKEAKEAQNLASE